jgi:hypothetical protein
MTVYLCGLLIQLDMLPEYLFHQRFKVALLLPQFLTGSRPLRGRVGPQLATIYGNQFPAYQSKTVALQQHRAQSSFTASAWLVMKYAMVS